MPPTWIQRRDTLLGRFVPLHLEPEVRRRALLFIAFSLQGVIFGCLFAGFYMAIGHRWGALIVLICTLAMAGAPWIVRAGGLERAGNVYAGVLVAGFTALTAIEGGIHGHAVAWLAVVPLCACILVDQRMGRVWCAVCLVIMGVFAALDLAGVALHPLYAPRWEGTVTAAGYLTLTFFMAMIGVFFERGRRHALHKLQLVLDELSAANTRLEELDKERSAFLGIAAHDLRSPLSSIMGFAQLMRDFGMDNLNEMQTESVVRILNASGRMRDLLDQFLSAEAINEGKVSLRREPCDLTVLAGGVVASQRANATAKHIDLVFQPQDGLGMVTADSNATVQILDNLLSNAIKFSPPSRAVTVRVLPAAGNVHGRSLASGHAVPANGPSSPGVRVEVQDAGPGLSEDDQQKLYGRFAKLSARPTAGEASNGLGLSIVKRLAEAMDGQIACRSRLGEGATFSLTLPRMAGG